MPSVPRPSTESRAALVGGVVGVPLALPPLVGWVAIGLLVAGIVAGHLTPEGADAYAAGGRAGLVVSVPLSGWFLLTNAGRLVGYDPVVVAVGGAAVTAAFIATFGHFAGWIGAGIGGWLAVQFGGKEPA